jgi:hypothetical protein
VCGGYRDPTLTTAELANELGVEQGRLARLAYDDGTGPGSGASAPARENLRGCRASGLRPSGAADGLAAAWLWGFCGDLGQRGRCLGHDDGLSFCIPAGEKGFQASRSSEPVSGFERLTCRLQDGCP